MALNAQVEAFTWLWGMSRLVVIETEKLEKMERSPERLQLSISRIRDCGFRCRL